MVRCFCLAGLALLSGCALFGSEPGIVSLPASFADPACREVAHIRASDTAANGWNAQTQARVAGDSYAACMADKAR
jgi:hypothetical protein